MAIDWGKTAELTALIGLGVYNGYKAWIDRKIRKHEETLNLKGNPTRCQEHADKINQLIDDVQRIKDHLGIV